MDEDTFRMQVNEEIDNEESMKDITEQISPSKVNRIMRVTFYYCPNCFKQRIKGLDDTSLSKCCVCNADLIKKEIAVEIDEEQEKKDSSKVGASQFQK